MAIELSDVTFSYPPSRRADRYPQPVLSIPHWQVSAGEKVLLLGESGAGKSTLLSLLSGLQTPNTGSVIILGDRIDRKSRRQRDRFRAANLGYVFQQFNLVPYLSSIDNLMLANHFGQAQSLSKKKAQSESELLLTRLQLPTERWHQPVRNLSVGQQQRVAIARALINKPKLLIADEPTSALDVINRQNFIELLMGLPESGDMTMVCVSHDPALMDYFSRIDHLGEINRAGVAV